MTRTARIASIIDKRRPLAEKIAGVEANLRNLDSALRHLESHHNQLMGQVDDPSIKGRLGEIDFSTIQQNIAKELQTLIKLKTRFSRDTLNIGVVGRARQGKSRLLQSLTGLTAAEIPDGDRQHCTGVRSTIHHNPDTDTYGEVWFHTERSFLDDVIAPYYKELELGAKPITVQEFANNPLPSLRANFTGAEVGAKYEHLKRYHGSFSKYENLLKASSPLRISKNQIREYIAQDTPDGQRVFFNYLAVKEVKIVCTFPNAEIGQIALVDMPGLGDTGIGDEERLIQTLGQDVDFVLFVRMPKTSGDYWADVDVKLYDITRSSLVDLPIDLWSFVVLNRTNRESNNGDNIENCKDLLSTITEKHIKVQKSLISNCGNATESNQLLEGILDYLAQNITDLDKEYAAACQERLAEIYKSVNAELSQAKSCFTQDAEDDYQGIQELFSNLFGNSDNGWWRDVALALQKIRAKLYYQRQSPNEELYLGMNAAIEACEQNRGILSSENALENINNNIRLKSAFKTYPDYQDELRVLISHHFLSLDDNLKETIELVKNQVVDVLKKNGRLEVLSDKQGTEFFEDIAKIIPDRLRKLKIGFEIVAKFQLSYRGLVLPRIRQHLDGLTNISATTGQYGGISEQQDKTLVVSKDTTADDILTALEINYDKAINTIKPTLEELLCEPNEAAYAMVEEFVDNLILQKDVKKEWENFLIGIRGQIWADIFGKKEQDRQMRKAWIESINQVTTVNQQDSLRFVN